MKEVRQGPKEKKRKKKKKKTAKREGKHILHTRKKGQAPFVAGGAIK